MPRVCREGACEPSVDDRHVPTRLRCQRCSVVALRQAVRGSLRRRAAVSGTRIGPPVACSASGPRPAQVGLASPRSIANHVVVLLLKETARDTRGSECSAMMVVRDQRWHRAPGESSNRAAGLQIIDRSHRRRRFRAPLNALCAHADVRAMHRYAHHPRSGGRFSCDRVAYIVKAIRTPPEHGVQASDRIASAKIGRCSATVRLEDSLKPLTRVATVSMIHVTGQPVTNA
jgi:hypothetical protein